MRFVLRSRDIAEDCEFALLTAKRWWEWKDPSMEFDVRYEEEEGGWFDPAFEYCPVGSVEFCSRRLPAKCRPRNVPECLRHMAGRKVYGPDELLKAYASGERPEVFVKSGLTIKHPSNGFHTLDPDALAKEFGEPLETMQICGLIEDQAVHEELSEWRAFVYNGEVLDVKNYAGDPYDAPNRDEVEHAALEMTRAGDCPPAYTIDVFQHRKNGIKWTSVMEVHDFFGCGLYGFDRPDRYPFMCVRWFSWFKRLNGRGGNAAGMI